MMTTYFSQSGLASLSEAWPAITYAADEAEPAVFVPVDEFLPFLQHLCQKEGFDRLGNLTAVDWQDCLEMVYHLYAMQRNEKLTVKVKLPHEAMPEIESATQVYPGAEFEEREVYDLMGIRFQHHPDMRRVLMPDDYPGHPLRKDFKAPTPSVEGGKVIWR
jgi:NADH-quinone oxidoreductase subunit C